ncbi:MAG: hypothetical protein JWN74_1587 [Acidobacteriaceae bacterium]|jgi:hypothetical protein|nr:hypothetical protein [Acidobacteriaceae bacterium]
MKPAIRAIYIATLLALTGLAQARDIQLTADPSVPAAEGKAELKHDRNGNLQVKLEVNHLASPTKLTPPKQVYVVWIQGRGKEPENHGQLKVNPDLKGSFEGTTPYPAFDIFITAEDNPAATTPTGPAVLKGSVQL